MLFYSIEPFHTAMQGSALELKDIDHVNECCVCAYTCLLIDKLLCLHINSIDLIVRSIRDAFYLLPLHKESQKWLRKASIVFFRMQYFASNAMKWMDSSDSSPQKCYHYLLAFISFQICMTYYYFVHNCPIDIHYMYTKPLQNLSNHLYRKREQCLQVRLAC